jgi:hypothetical protein
VGVWRLRRIDLDTDRNNCGGCGVVCTLDQVCFYGACLPCAQAGFADCDKNPANGCETYVGGDSSNCGACGNVCPWSASFCSGGQCLGFCEPPFLNCGHRSSCDVDTSQDPRNCGACGHDCGSPPNANSYCSINFCLLGTCYPGFADCDGIYFDGCESRSAIDRSNCGACRNVCASGQVCSQGSCVAASCGDGRQDGNETGVDCGGPDCPRCEMGGGCLTDCDCERAPPGPFFCIGGLCAPCTGAGCRAAGTCATTVIAGAWYA